MHAQRPEAGDRTHQDEISRRVADISDARAPIE
jgi:hypothetical protein